MGQVPDKPPDHGEEQNGLYDCPDETLTGDLFHRREVGGMRNTQGGELLVVLPDDDLKGFGGKYCQGWAWNNPRRPLTAKSQ